ncbi:hypothetical protein LGM71_32790 [Burkholderia sp. AU33545]|nr:hypothetical protein [Burkholderia sp. AU33545]MCA8205810.1 hypothetical protein [Burkholderia sp. AU33545]
MPIADLIDSGIGSIRGIGMSLFYPGDIDNDLYPDKNGVIPIPAHGQP